ncbi:MAG: nucleotidyltransferase domain-containing protein [Candidatus Falkowbacteria bacterium]|nr:nucleotidyltransferase domain-containing protein [Candidatus Parcubacteria bacterium]
MDILKLTKSKTRKKILQLFFADLAKKYYLRELERIINISVGNIRRELISLEQSGVFKHERMGKQVYYSVNQQSPIFQEFKKIIAKTIGSEALIKNAFKNIKGMEIAFIFGSFAKSEEDSLSDIDLMIIGKPDEDIVMSKINKLESRLSREINYHIFSIVDWQKKIKQRNSFLKNILSKPKIFLIGNDNYLSKIN